MKQSRHVTTTRLQSKAKVVLCAMIVIDQDECETSVSCSAIQVSEDCYTGGLRH